MRIVAVSGGGSHAGKTTLISALIRSLPGWGALKTSPSGVPHRHPSEGVEYEIVTDRGRLMSPGTDTRSYIDAGAIAAAWLVARPPVRRSVVEEALGAFAGCAGLLIEGGSLAESFDPGLRYAIVRAGAPIKPEALRRIEEADLVVVNVPAGTPAAEAATPPSGLRCRRVATLDAADPGDPGVAALAAEIRAWARC